MKPKPDCHDIGDRIPNLLLLCVLSLWLASCAVSPDRRHPEFSDRIGPIKVLCILPADVIVYEEMSDGRLIHRSDWSLAAREDIYQTLSDEFKARNYRVQTFPESQWHQESELQEIFTLYRAVNKSIQLHTFGPDIFPAKKTQFDYSVGPLHSLRGRNDADGFVFARVLYRGGAELARSYVSLGLADGSGTIIWYGANGIQEQRGERKFNSTLVLVRKILADFPGSRL